MQIKTVMDEAVARAAGVHPQQRQKVAEPSNLLQDFAGGLDPFGVWTSDYGRRAENAGLSEGEHRLKQLTATAGGVIGGSLLVPSAIVGVTEGFKGLAGPGNLKQRLSRGGAGFVQGFTSPVRTLRQVSTARKSLKRVAEGGTLSPEDYAVVIDVMENQGIPVSKIRDTYRAAHKDVSARYSQMNPSERKIVDAVSKRVTGKSVGDSLSDTQHFDDILRDAMNSDAGRDAARRALPGLRSAHNSAKAQMALGGVVGGGGAAYQYGSGRETERQTSPLARFKRVFTG